MITRIVNTRIRHLILLCMQWSAFEIVLPKHNYLNLNSSTIVSHTISSMIGPHLKDFFNLDNPRWSLFSFGKFLWQWKKIHFYLLLFWLYTFGFLVEDSLSLVYGGPRGLGTSPWKKVTSLLWLLITNSWTRKIKSGLIMRKQSWNCIFLICISLLLIVSIVFRGGEREITLGWIRLG